MATKLIHLNNATPGLVPASSELVAGQIAINTADKIIYTLASDGTVAAFASGGGGEGTVTTVNDVAPDGSGNVELTPTDLGATTLGNALFLAATSAAARASLGSTTVGDAVFIAASQGAALTALGASSVGTSVFTATDQATAVSALGASSIGADLFTIDNVADAQTAIGITAVGSNIATAGTIADVVTYLGVVPTSAIGANSGVAPLDSSGKVPTANLPGSILGGVNYQGTFVPGTSTLPAAASGNKGWYYVATAAGTYTPPGGTLLTFAQGDYLISDGTEWTVLDAQDSVSSVNGKTGTVVIAATDITTGIFASAQLGASPGDNQILTTNGTGASTWTSQVPAINLGAGTNTSAVLTTDSGSNPTWVSTVPIANLPVATAAALGLAQAGSGLSVSAGVLAVNTAALTLDEGTYTGV